MTVRRLFGNLAALAVALLVSLAAGEAVLRAFVTLPLPRIDPEVRYRPHAERRFTLLPNQTAYSYGAPVRIDERGFRVNGSGEYGAAAAPPIIALGDSFTFGLGVRNEETWPAQLEARLRDSTAHAVSVINAGTISYGVSQELDLLRSEVGRLQPAVVVHGLYWNDYMTMGTASDGAGVLTPDGYFTWDRPANTRSVPRRLVSWAFSRSAFLFALRQLAARGDRRGTSAYARAFDTMVDRGLTAEDWEPIENFYRNVLALGREHGFATFVVIMPVNTIVERPGAQHHPFAAEARRRLEALGIPYVDGFSVWSERADGGRLFLPQGPDAHLNAQGYQLVGEAVADGLLRSAATAQALRAGATTGSATPADEAGPPKAEP